MTEVRAFDATILSRLRTTQESAMQDTCQIGAYDYVEDGYGNPTPQYTYGSALSCGFQHVRPREVQGSGEVPVIDARVRLPIATTIDERDRVKITHRYGEALATAQVFDIVGPMERGPSGLQINLKLVTKE
jgi:hypothetical protein